MHNVLELSEARSFTTIPRSLGTYLELVQLL